MYSAEIGPICVHQRSWYLVHCKSRQDERAEENLKRQGYEIFRPKCRHQRLVRGKYEHVEESLFPGYLFIHLPEESNWGPLRSTRGVNRVVAFGGVPLAVSTDLVNQIQARGDATIHSELKVGDNVRILEGGFSDFDAIFMAMDGDERVILLINLLNRQQRVSMPMANLKSDSRATGSY